MFIPVGSVSAAAAPSMMSMMAPAALLGGLGLAGSMMSISNQSSANSKALKWQRYNMQHAHQWEVEDLKKAGLNPILSAGGSGAVAGTVPNAPLPNVEMSDFASGLQVVQTLQNIKESQARIDLLGEQKTSESGKPQNIVGELKESITSNAKDVKENAIPTAAYIKDGLVGAIKANIDDFVKRQKLNSAKTKKQIGEIKLPEKGIFTSPENQALRYKYRSGDYMDTNYDWR